MNATISELLAILSEETACYRNMQSILAEEEASISLSRKEQFDQVQLDKEALVIKLQRVEEKRRGLVGQLSAATATNGQPLTVSQLAQAANPPYKEKLLSQANHLRSIIGDVHEKNRRNELLIHLYLNLVKGSLKLLGNLIDDNSVYQKPGTQQPVVKYRAGGGRVICGTA